MLFVVLVTLAAFDRERTIVVLVIYLSAVFTDEGDVFLIVIANLVEGAGRRYEQSKVMLVRRQLEGSLC